MNIWSKFNLNRSDGPKLGDRLTSVLFLLVFLNVFLREMRWNYPETPNKLYMSSGSNSTRVIVFFSFSWLAICLEADSEPKQTLLQQREKCYNKPGIRWLKLNTSCGDEARTESFPCLFSLHLIGLVFFKCLFWSGRSHLITRTAWQQDTDLCGAHWHNATIPATCGGSLPHVRFTTIF